MQTQSVIHTVSCHAEGEVGDVIVGGVLPPKGDTVWEQSRSIANDGWLRNFMLNEPRGGVFRHINLLVPAVNPKADAAFIIMEPADTPPMSGSNSLCVATVLLETGILPIKEPTTHFVLEAPGGIVDITAHCHNGKVERVAVQNVPSFAAKLDTTLEVTGLGTLTVDTAYGGDSFVIVNSQDLGLTLSADEARDLAITGMQITQAANEQLGFSHPHNPDWAHISFCQFAAPVILQNGVKTGRNAVAIRPGKIDRSPTGTGCSARMAVLHARGELGINESFVGESIIGSHFQCHIASTGSINNDGSSIPTVTPVIAGRAFITGTHQHFCDPRDPWPQGYRLSDTWPTIS